MAPPQQRRERPGDPPRSAVRTLGHDRGQIEALCETIIAQMLAHGLSETATFAFRLAWEEAVSNAIHHGNRDRPDGVIEVAHLVNDAGASVRITDQGDGFDPTAVVDPTLDENLECPTGRGLLLMRAYMTRVEFEPPGNTVRLIYERPPSSR